MRLLVAALALTAPAVAHAQALQCTAPGAIPRPRPELPSASEPKRVLPIGSYTLAITWAPEACHGRQDDPDMAFECRSGQRFGWTLHGLWPDGEGATWPQYCASTEILPEPLLRRHLCATPSAQLLQHEYAKHGTCMGVPPADYLRRSTSLYAKLRYPDMKALAGRRDLTVAAFAKAFAAANRGMRADMMRLNVNKAGWLEEVWLCLDTSFRMRSCPAHAGGAALSTPIRIAPPR